MTSKQSKNTYEPKVTRQIVNLGGGVHMVKETVRITPRGKDGKLLTLRELQDNPNAFLPDGWKI